MVLQVRPLRCWLAAMQAAESVAAALSNELSACQWPKHLQIDTIETLITDAPANFGPPVPHAGVRGIVAVRPSCHLATINNVALHGRHSNLLWRLTCSVSMPEHGRYRASY